METEMASLNTKSKVSIVNNSPTPSTHDLYDFNTMMTNNNSEEDNMDQERNYFSKKSKDFNSEMSYIEKKIEQDSESSDDGSDVMDDITDTETETPRRMKKSMGRAVVGVEGVANPVKVNPERFRHFVQLLHKCYAENNQAQSLEIEVIRTYFAKAEEKNPFNITEIDAYIGKMTYEKKLMRSQNTVFTI